MGTGEQRRGQTWVWVGVGVAVIVVGIFAFLAGLYSTGTGVPSTTYYPFFPMGLGWIGALFSLFFFFWGLSWFFRPWRWGYRRGHRWWRYDDAESILKERYVRGEITKEQFEHMMRDLEQHR